MSLGSKVYRPRNAREQKPVTLDWASLRLVCIGVAQRRGCTDDQAEDVAQDTLTVVLEKKPEHAFGFALVVSDRLAIRVRQGMARMVELVDEPTREATQEAHVQAMQLGFLVRLKLPGNALEALDDAEGSAGRMRRMRAREAVREALQEVGGG